MSRAVLFAILAGVSAATWTVCLKLASTNITPALGALVITTGALGSTRSSCLATRPGALDRLHPRGLFSPRWGRRPAGVDISLFRPTTGPAGPSSFFSGHLHLLVVLSGFLLFQEPFTWMRLLAIGLIVGGSLLLQAQGG